MSAKDDSDQKSQKAAGSEGGKTPRGSQAGTPRSSQYGGSRPVSRQPSRADSQMTPRGSKNSRINKIYRTPPTPPPQEHGEKEKGFVLDCNAVSSISTDYNKANPKLGPVIPPYNSQHDKHVRDYFNYIGVDRTLRRTGQCNKKVDKNTGEEFYDTGTSIDGPVMDYFHEKGKGHYYLSKRNINGSGRSEEQVNGHAQFMQGIKPVTGYNGKFGFRRNTPWLRQMPSPFGTASTSPTH